jgi:hypothetical protein
MQKKFDRCEPTRQDPNWEGQGTKYRNHEEYDSVMMIQESGYFIKTL